MPNEVAAVRGANGIPLELVGGDRVAPAHQGSIAYGGVPATWSYNTPHSPIHQACMAVRRKDGAKCPEPRVEGQELCAAHGRAAEAATQK